MTEQYYLHERNIFSFNQRHLSGHDALLLAGKIARHFKLGLRVRQVYNVRDYKYGYVGIYFRGNRDSGIVRRCDSASPVIRVSKNPSVLVVAHEMAHIIAARHGQFSDNTLGFDKWNNLVQYWCKDHQWISKRLKGAK